MSHDSAVLTSARPRRQAPGPRGYPLVGVVPQFARDPLDFVMAATRRYGEVVRLPWAGPANYLVNHPDYIKHVLQDNNRNYGRDARFTKLKVLAGEGLVTSDGELWRRQRRLMQPAFHRQQLAGLATSMTDLTRAMLAGWQAVAERGEPLNVAEAMMCLTRDIVVKTLFNTEAGSGVNAVSETLIAAFTFLNRRLTALVNLPLSWPTPANRRFHRAQRTLDQFVYAIIDERRRSGQTDGSLLSTLLNTRDEETGEVMNDRQLRDEVLTLYLAGHETTAVTTTWAWYLLAQNPDVERRLHAEVDRVLGGRVPTFQDLADLPYTRKVFDETLRLYPPAWAISREALHDDEIGGYHIPAGATVLLSSYAMHRHPDYWENPEQFDPDRFSEERSANRPRYAYFPFGGGPRICIGNNFALMEAPLILATVAQAYCLSLAPGSSVEPETLLTLRPRQGVRMILHKRDV